MTRSCEKTWPCNFDRRKTDGTSEQQVGRSKMAKHENPVKDTERRRSFSPGQNSFTESTPLVLSSASQGSERAFVKSYRELSKSLTFKHAFAYVVGLLFASGIFISPSLVARETNNMGMAIIVWIVSGIPCLLGALCFCELACMHRKVGGEYIYILEAYGEVVAFIAIWAQATVIMPLVLAILALTVGEHVAEPFLDITTTTGVWVTKSIAVAGILVCLLANSFSSSIVGKIQIIVTSIQYISIAFLVILGIYRLSTGHTENYPAMFSNTSDFNLGNFGLALYNGLWAYDGWGLVSSISEELENLERDLWLSIVTGIPFVVLCYVLINFALMSGLSHKEIANSSTVAITFVEKILGKKVALVIPFAVGLSCLGCVCGNFFVLSRVILSAAREGHLPYTLCYIHKKQRTPIPAALTLSLLSIIWLLPLGNGMEALITYFSFAVWSQYLLAIFSVIIMRIRKPELERPFRVWLINPIFTSLCSLFLVVIPFVKRPVESSVCLAVLLSAIPVYYLFIYYHKRRSSCLTNATDKLNDFLTAKFNLVPCVFLEEANENIEKETKV